MAFSPSVHISQSLSASPVVRYDHYGHINTLYRSPFSSLLRVLSTIVFGNSCTHAQTTSPSSTPTRKTAHTQSPLVRLSNKFPLPLGGLKGCHRFCRKARLKAWCHPFRSHPSLSLCLVLSLLLSVPLCPHFPFIYAHKSRGEGDIFNQKRKKYDSINPATPTIIMLGWCICLCLSAHLHTFVFRDTRTVMKYTHQPQH